MKKILLIGAAGFVGPYLYKNLKDHGYEVVATKTKNETPNNDIEYIDLDILNKEEKSFALSFNCATFSKFIEFRISVVIGRFESKEIRALKYSFTTSDCRSVKTNFADSISSNEI